MDAVKNLVGKLRFYLEEKEAYTEDHVLVYNLFIYKLPHSITAQDMKAYFRRFGHVLKLRLTGYHKGGGRYGYVNFKEAESAAKVLRYNKHQIKKKSFAVEPSDTWHQPMPRELSPPETASPLGAYRKPTTSDNIDLGPAAKPSIDGLQLVDLNDDCLQHILKFLGIRDQLNFARVSETFSGIVEMVFKTNYRVVDCESLLIPLTKWEVRDFFKLVGPHVEVLKCNFYSVRAERFIIKYVTDLKDLTIRLLPKNEKHSLLKMVRKFVSLTKLCLQYCEVDDFTLATICRLPNLEVLQLGGNFSLVGENLKLFPRLKDLNLSCCFNIQRDHFIAMCESLTELRSLDVSFCKEVDDGCLRHMVQHCTKLETVKMDISRFPGDVVATLPNLKRLAIIVEEYRFLVPLCQELAKHQANQLEELLITMRNVTEICKEAAQSIGKLKKLRLLELSNFRVDDEGLSHFHRLKSLQYITLCGCLTDEVVLRLLGSCQTVGYVNIFGCNSLSANFLESATEMLRSQGRKVVKKKDFNAKKGHYFFSISDY